MSAAPGCERALTNTTSAVASSAATLGLGSNVWLSVPSGITPPTLARAPATLAISDVIGATVVTTWRGPLRATVGDWPVVAAAGGQVKEVGGGGGGGADRPRAQAPAARATTASV